MMHGSVKPLVAFVANYDGYSIEDFLFRVLSDASDDLSGVYEVWWQANALYPKWPLSRCLQLAEEAVATLVRDRLVRLYRGDWKTASSHPISLDETEAVLRMWDTWAIPDGPRVFLFATQEGIAILQRRARE
jgi:hypothetical protein